MLPPLSISWADRRAIAEDAVEYTPPVPGIKRIAFIGNYLPRQCGIATFTADLCESVAAEFPDTHCLVLPINDIEEGYALSLIHI